MTLARTLDALIDHVRFRIEEGERVAEVSPATLAALRGTAAPAPAKPPAAPTDRRRPSPPPATAPAASRQPPAVPPPPDVADNRQPATDAPAAPTPPYTRFGTSPELDAIAARIAACRRCTLCQQRRQVVPGQGPVRPELAFVGEGPGADEDEQGLAFVGRAGQLLTRMIVGMGLQRDAVWIGNIVKCRPPDNRTPLPEEMDACLPFLREQLALLKPRVIVALGATAVKGLLGVQTGITRLRGTWLSFEGIDVMPTYHPSYLLRSGGESGGNARYWDVWQDLCAVLERLGRPIPPRKRGAD